MKIVIGASGYFQSDWVPTDIDHLNMLCLEDWRRYFKEESIDSLLAEHVWEHLSPEEAMVAAKNCCKYLKTGGYIRVAVPDGYHPSEDYRSAVKPGGHGAGSDDHKIMYNYKTLTKVFSDAGFKVELLEYFDENGNFQQAEWDECDGLIRRSSGHDWRNVENKLAYTSIILDARKI